MSGLNINQIRTTAAAITATAPGTKFTETLKITNLFEARYDLPCCFLLKIADFVSKLDCYLLKIACTQLPLFCFAL